MGMGGCREQVDLEANTNTAQDAHGARLAIATRTTQIFILVRLRFAMTGLTMTAMENVILQLQIALMGARLVILHARHLIQRLQ
jgi:hypothetical protein